MCLKNKFSLWLLLCCCYAVGAIGQDCTTIGQNPSTAFPVCGTKTFTQHSVPVCGDKMIPGPVCNTPGNGTHTDKNPFWYKFTCYVAGTLGFSITPLVLSDDYDWQLFDVTGRNPNDVYTDGSLYVAMNWSGDGGITGASAAGTSLDVCGGWGQPLWSSLPVLKLGHQYLLLISHFTDSQSGYELTFGGGTGVITDPTLPEMQRATYVCASMAVGVKLNKKVRCNTLATNGSDFTFSTPGPVIKGATGVGCNNGFDLDSMVLQLDQPLAPGTYTIVAKKGGDNNTVLDACDNAMVTGESVSFTVPPQPAVLLRNIATAGCAPKELKIGLSVPVRCNSIAPNGSDFTISGPAPVTISGAAGICNSSNMADSIILQLAAPIQKGGVYTITLRSGTDNNTLLSECWQRAAPGQLATVLAADTVSADFTYTSENNCKITTFQFVHDGAHSVNSWKWLFDGTDPRTEQRPVKTYFGFGNKQVDLVVSNGVCRDSVSKIITLESKLVAAFEVDPGPYCPLDVTTITNKSYGNNIIAWRWDYGNGMTTTGERPISLQYLPNKKEQQFRIRLIIENDVRCQDTADHYITAVSSCYIDVPTAFSPNSDGNNDFFYPLNAYKAVDLHFAVYNRVGGLIFESNDWRKRWDGTVKGQPADIGTYVWMLQYTEKESGKKVFRKGTVVLLR